MQLKEGLGMHGKLVGHVNKRKRNLSHVVVSVARQLMKSQAVIQSWVRLFANEQKSNYESGPETMDIAPSKCLHDSTLKLLNILQTSTEHADKKMGR